MNKQQIAHIKAASTVNCWIYNAKRNTGMSASQAVKLLLEEREKMVAAIADIKAALKTVKGEEA